MIEVSVYDINGSRKKTEFGFRNDLILKWWLQEPVAPALVLTQIGTVCEGLSWWKRSRVGTPVNSQTYNHTCFALKAKSQLTHGISLVPDFGQKGRVCET